MTLSFLLMMCASVFAAGPQYLSPEIHEALRAKVAGKATPRQEALLFANNDAINRARLARQIPDAQYQAAQEHFKQLNRQFAADAAIDANAGFEVQKSKASRSQPGTDSDYIADVSSPEQIKQMQSGYNQRINDYLKEHEVIAGDRNDWHQRLDTDFMADPKGVSRSEFAEVGSYNNDAYVRPEAANWEYKSRNPEAGAISQRETVEYTSEMEDFRNKKQRQIRELQAKNIEKGTLDEGKLIQKQAQQQKYDSRIGDADARYRADHGLSKSTNPTHDLAQMGAIREPDVTEDMARELLGKPAGEPLSASDMQHAQRKFDAKRQTAFATEQNIYQNAKRSMAEGIMEKGQLDAEVDQWMRQNYPTHADANGTYAKSAAKDAAQVMENMSPSEKGRFMSEVQNRLPKDPQTGDMTAESRQLMNELRGEMALRPGKKPVVAGPDPTDVAVIGKHGKARVTPVDGPTTKHGSSSPLMDPLTAVETGVQMSEATARQLGKVLDRDDKSFTTQDMAEIIGEGSGYMPMRHAVEDTRLSQQMQKIELQNQIRELESKPGSRSTAEQAKLDRLKAQEAYADSTTANLEDLGKQMFVEPNKEIAGRRWSEMEAQVKAEGRKPEFLRDGVPAMAKIGAEVAGAALGISTAANTAAEMETFDSRAQWSEQKKAILQDLTNQALRTSKSTNQAVAELEGILYSGQAHEPGNLQRIDQLLGIIAANRDKMQKMAAIANGHLSEVDPQKLGVLRGLVGAHPDPASLSDYARQLSEESRRNAATIQASTGDADRSTTDPDDSGWGSAEAGYADQSTGSQLTAEEALTERITEIMLTETDPQRRKALIREAIKQHANDGNAKSANEDGIWGDGEYEQASAAEPYIQSIVAANGACEFGRAWNLAKKARDLDPSHEWLNQNYATLRTLAERDQAFRGALQSAIRHLEQGEVSQSIGSLKVAMANASTQCGQDQTVRNILEDAKRIAKMERDSLVAEARMEGQRSAWEREQARERFAREKDERRRSARALQGALMGVLGTAQHIQTARSRSSGVTSDPTQGEDIFDRMTRENERKYGRMMDKYRDSQNDFRAKAPSVSRSDPPEVDDDLGWQPTPPAHEDVTPEPCGGPLGPAKGGFETSECDR
ncbi:MAG: hypothetical protein ABW076_00715 [Candidatus Thiodiazotropha sp.]